jgi:MFS family permease
MMLNSNIKNLKLCLFSASLATNLFLEMVIIVNALSIRYYLYSSPMTIQINFMPSPWNMLLWIGTLYVAYITRDAANASSSRTRLTALFLDMSLVGSLVLLLSLLLANINMIQQQTMTVPNGLQFLIDALGYALSFLGISLALLTYLVSDKRIRQLLLIYFFSILITIEIWSLAHWIAYPFDVASYLGFAWQGAFLEIQISNIFYPTISYLFVAFLFSWVWIPIMLLVKKRIKNLVGPNSKITAFLSTTVNASNQTQSKSSNVESATEEKSLPNRHTGFAILLMSLFLGVFIAFYPYINPQPGLIGTDSLGYYYTLTALAGKSLQNAARLTIQINNARVLYFLALYLIGTITGISPYTLIQLMPIATIIANVLAIFWFVKTGEGKMLLGATAALFSLFSLNTTIAMHSGILANWFAMALGFMGFGLILKLEKRSDVKIILATIVVWFTLFLIHYWSAAFFLIVLGFYLFLRSFERFGKKRKLILGTLLIGIASLAIVSSEYLISIFFAPYGSTQNANHANIAVLFWTKLQTLIDSWFFGAFANPVMFILTIIGATSYFYRRTSFNRLITAWTICGSLLSVLVSPIGANMNQWLTWRTLYLLPLQISAALGIFVLVSKLRTKEDGIYLKTGDNNPMRRPLTSSPYKQEIMTVFYLGIGYGFGAFLLVLGIPIVLVLVFLSPLVVSLINLKSKRTEKNVILAFIFVTFVTLVLFNYTLRSLAPLTLNRMQP